MIIVITGSPGTGKTAVARMLAKKLGCRLVDIKRTVNKNRIYKIEQGEKVVDLKKLGNLLLEEITAQKRKNENGDLIIEGHLACEISLPAKFVFVLRCNPKTLRRRLEERGYSEDKTRENLLAEMLDYCTLLARKNFKGKRIIEIETSRKSIKKCVTEIRSIMNGKRKEIDNVNYSRELEKFVREMNGRP